MYFLTSSSTQYMGDVLCAAMHILVCPSILKHLASSLETRRNKELIFFFYNLVFPGKIRKVFSQSLGWAGLGTVQCGQIINDYCLDILRVSATVMS